MSAINDHIIDWITKCTKQYCSSCEKNDLPLWPVRIKLNRAFSWTKRCMNEVAATQTSQIIRAPSGCLQNLWLLFLKWWSVSYHGYISQNVFKGALDKYSIYLFISYFIEDFKSNQYRNFQLIPTMSFHFMWYFVKSSSSECPYVLCIIWSRVWKIENARNIYICSKASQSRT